MPENAKNKKSTTMRVIHSPFSEEKREKKRESFESQKIHFSISKSDENKLKNLKSEIY